MRTKIPDAEKMPITADPNDPVALYLQSIADGKVFADDPSGNLTGDESMEQIINIAIGLEKDSIIFYQSMMELIPKKTSVVFTECMLQMEMLTAALIFLT